MTLTPFTSNFALLCNGRFRAAIVTDARGGPLDAPLALDPEIAWAGYANADIRNQIEPLLQSALRRRGLIDSD